MDIRYLTVVSSIKLLDDLSYIDMDRGDFDFLTSDQIWLARDRQRARRCIESVAYGALDLIGLPRFALPAEFIAGVIAKFVHNVNSLIACSIMEGFEFTDNIITGTERKILARELFSHVLRIDSGYYSDVSNSERNERLKLRVQESLNGSS